MQQAVLVFPPNGYLFNTHTCEQQDFIRNAKLLGTYEAIRHLDAIQHEREFSYPAVLPLAWSNTEGEVLLEISETPDFKEAKTVRLDKNSYLMQNCKTGQTYFWRINGGEVWTFQTMDGIRFLHIDGIRNVRDLGGNKIKQGLVFRGCEPEPLYHITEEGKRVATEELKIKTQLDLRLEFFGKIDSSAFGEGVALKQIPYRPYKEIVEEQHKKAICEIMEFLSHEENYPVYFHCKGGADRTGMIAFYLKALLGEKEEDIFLDYEATSLSRIPVNDSNTVNGFRCIKNDYFVEFLDILNTYAPNGTMYEKVTNFLLDCGVQKDCLERIKSILKK